MPFIGELRMFAGNFPPLGWEFCNGQLLPISENDALFTLIGTTYGGDGQETFALPNLQSRIPIHMGQGGGLANRQLGETGGAEEVTLTTQQIPVHTHTPLASSGPANSTSPAGGLLASPTSTQTGILSYGSDTVAAMNAQSVTPTGGSQPHTNVQPYLVISYIISLFGDFPTQT